jgi:hypothetical protein
MTLSLINFTDLGKTDFRSDESKGTARYFARKAREIARHFMDKACYPIGKEKDNLVNKMHSAAYDLEYGLDLGEGEYRGYLHLYRSLLEQLEKDSPPEISDIAANLIDEIENMKSYMKIRKISALLKEQLKKQIPAETCDRMDIFMGYLNSLKSSGKVDDIVIFTMPSEKRIRYFNDKGLIENEEGCIDFLLADYINVCGIVSSNGLACYDLSGSFARHYSNPGNNALILDDEHLTPEGSERVASWIMHLTPLPRK